MSTENNVKEKMVSGETVSPASENPILVEPLVDPSVETPKISLRDALKQKILMKKVQRTSQASIKHVRDKFTEKYEELKKSNPDLANDIKKKFEQMGGKNLE